MVNWQDPSTVQQNYYTLSVSVIIISQVSGGIYLWEWVTTLYFDLRLLSGGRQGFKWPSLVYISSRISTLITIICEFIFLNRKFEKHCDAMIHVILFFGYLATILSSTLIAIRITGIWNRKRPVIIFAVSVILADIVMILYAFIRGRGAAWNPVLQACIEIDTIRVQTSAVAVFVLDVLMFVVMIIGIWMMRVSGSLWRVVYHQGIIWFLVAVIAYTPLVVLISLNLNDAINRLWQTPFFVAMTICAARMHRGLFEHANSYPSTEEVSQIKFNYSAVSVLEPETMSINSTADTATTTAQTPHIAEDNNTRVFIPTSDV
ncbi:hypothetical protein A0H81_02950 [Grifola frondosa]|uniref:Uncharacterized protein n=1 Tax=Grifola frondosa TaxID=5627 RepID=A0A1C7MH62_GRIFR|nr:hypothetical protein A0H81_02950 [Grifola frondosa]